ncbi:MAG: DNA adenine methylase, partial [Candidatus Asgardarchaeum californiense]
LALLAEQSEAKVLISNHDTKFSRELYKNAKKTTELLVTRFISADGDKRKPVKELLVEY